MTACYEAFQRENGNTIWSHQLYTHVKTQKRDIETRGLLEKALYGKRRLAKEAAVTG